MQTRALRTLARIASVGSFATAAAQMNMTLSAVSMQMKTLEKELDASLFDRRFRPPKLTPVGRRIAQQAAELLAVEERIVDLCRNETALVGRYRIGFVSTASVRLLPDFLANAAKRAPDALFEVEVALSESLEEKVLNGQLDAAVVTATESSARRLRTATLRAERFVFAAPRAYGATAADLLGGPFPFLEFAPDSGIGKLISAYMAAHRREGRGGREDGQPTMMLDSVEAIVECVNRGLGYTILPEPDVRRYGDAEAVAVIEPDIGLSRRLALAALPTSPFGRRLDFAAALFS